MCLAMVPMLVLIWALIALGGPPLGTLWNRPAALAVGDIIVNEYRTRRSELESHS